MFKHARTALAVAGIGLLTAGTANAFIVNGSFSGTWYNPQQSGRGAIIDIVDTGDFDKSVVVWVFTGREGAPLWLEAQGTIDNDTNTAELNVIEVSGVTFGPDHTGADTVRNPWGSGSITFNSCSSATLTLNGDDGVYDEQIQALYLGDNQQCVVDEVFSGCPAFASDGPLPGSCIVGGDVTQHITLTNETLWLIQGQLRINDGASVTMEPNTEIVGGTLDDTDTLVVLQGGQIFSEGTAQNPVVMRGPNGEGRAEWGGVVINGNAPINGCAEGVSPCTAQGEGNSGIYGGNDPHDNSGVLRYTIVSNAGRLFNEENELNGIAFQGVGDGTTVEYVQVHLNEDDGVEFFGGTVNARYLVLTGIGDDSLDWTQGWQGKAQYIVARQYTDDGDQGIEADNNGDANDSLPRAKPMLANMTFIGEQDIGWLLREGTGANIANSIVTGFGDSCIDIDHQSTFDNIDNLTVVNSIAFGCGVTFGESPDDPFSVADWFFSQEGNVEVDPMLSGYLPMPGSPALGIGTVPFQDDFFDNVDYAGAFSSREADWTKPWAIGLDRSTP